MGYEITSTADSFSISLFCCYTDNYRPCRSSGWKFTGRDEHWKTHLKFFFLLICHIFLAFHISRNQLLIAWHIISSLSVFLVYWFRLSGRPWRRDWESSQVLLPGFCQDVVGRHQWGRWEACTSFTGSSASVLCGLQQVSLLRFKI